MIGACGAPGVSRDGAPSRDRTAPSLWTNVRLCSFQSRKSRYDEPRLPELEGWRDTACPVRAESRTLDDAGSQDAIRTRAYRVRKNLPQGMALAWAASPSSLIRYSVLGMVSATMPPIAVYLGAVLVNRIAEARVTRSSRATCCRSSSACGWRPVCSGRSAPTWDTAGTCSSAACSSRPSGGCSPRRRRSTSGTSTTPTGTIASRAPSATSRGGRAT